MMTIEQARRVVGQRLGIPGFDGTRAGYSDLSQQDQERVSVATTAFVLQNPAEFTAAQVATSKLAASKVNFGKLGNYAPGSFLDDAVVFLKAYGETAGNVITGAAGIAGRSLAALGINLGVLVTVAAVAAVLYFGAPVVLPKLRAAWKAKATK